MIYDISAPFSPDLPFYTGDPVLSIQPASSIAGGDASNVSHFSFGCHTGTHVDVPKHFLDHGKSLSDLPPEHFMGPALVVEALGVPAITKAEVEAIPGDLTGRIVLFRTDNGDAMLRGRFNTAFVALREDGAKALCDRKVKGVGLDYLSVDPFGTPGFPAHHILLGQGLLVIEGLLLTEVPPGPYQVIALPLKVPGGNGCPVRAVLLPAQG